MRRLTFLILCLEGAVLSFNVAAASALVPSIAREFLVTEFFAGKIIWLYMLPYGIAALLYGPLVRVFDARRVELICFGLFCLANLFVGFAQNIASLFFARFCMGVFGASVIPLVIILIARHTEANKRGAKIGLFFSATFVASLLGLLLSGILPWRLIFLLPGFLGIALLIIMYFYLPSFKEDNPGFKVHYLKAIKNKTVVAVFTYIFIISLFYHGVQQWLGVYFATRVGLNQFLVSMFITLTSLSGIFGEVVGGKLADSLGRIKTIDLGIVLMVLSVSALLFKLPIFILALIMVIWGFGWTLNHAGLSTMLTDLPKEFLNEAASLNSGVRFVSGGLGAVLAAGLMQRSFNLGFFVFGVGLIILAILAKKILKEA